jgi:hypothetical protein
MISTNNPKIERLNKLEFVLRVATPQLDDRPTRWWPPVGRRTWKDLAETVADTVPGEVPSFSDEFIISLRFYSDSICPENKNLILLSSPE